MAAAMALAGCTYAVREDVARDPVTRLEVVRLTRAGVADDTIIARVHREGMSETLSAEEIVSLKQDGVSDRVIQSMISAPVAQPRRTIVYRYVDPVWWWGGLQIGWYYGRYWHPYWYWHRCPRP